MTDPAPKTEARIVLFRQNGDPAGHINIPMDVLEAAAKVERWMQANRVTTLHGLRLA